MSQKISSRCRRTLRRLVFVLVFLGALRVLSRFALGQFADLVEKEFRADEAA